MAKTRTYYDLLISCPSDVKEELEVINESVSNFNRMFGRINNISIDTKHWSKDSYPQSGGRPQELLNQQFVLDCDAAVAVFWTRFGTPTDEYGSGTEEEIEKLIQSGKQVFLYFCDKEAKLSDVDWEQYQKIQEFKEKYKHNNIFSTYSTLEELEKQFLNHLTLYFLDKHVKGGEEPLEPKSELSIKGVSNGEPIENMKVTKSSFSNSEFITHLNTEIISQFDSIKQYHFTSEQEETYNKNSWPTVTLAFMNGITKEVAVSAKKQKIICDFAENNNIEINKISFFDLGGLKQKESQIITGSVTYVGTDKAKEKLKEIERLFDNIKRYDQWVSYFEKLDSKYYLRLCLSNQGNRYDEDIDVKIFIKEGLLCKPEDIPIPEYQIIEECEKSILPLFQDKPSLSINGYDEYPIEPHIPVLPYFTVEENAKQLKAKFKRRLNNIFIYGCYNQNGYDILTFKQSYLKHKNNVLFPSILLFNSKPDSVRFEIQSKFSSEIVTSEIEFN
ncbi:hypothetical protein MOC76_16855 [Bacillus spizizenii]|uniref:hypothetical protein n=1 Tax=Bacillus spizizenii TaxID=96241 RepID=UPI002280FA25|nr:hypothetical protein [Bacillus spizizenii]MCY8063958.1 hypothetical protein [Bacillus spizizenii]MCY8135428.1 hypothetical protein [Bacillus spizizenii]MCY8260456.1 hypothetical protein [Bacillus spizizenii]MCY8333215.1 hypothetical protein [Bacillus spizizenii]MCY9444438.1 hypothetical protein [Bacillus spizizenii]